MEWRKLLCQWLCSTKCSYKHIAFIGLVWIIVSFYYQHQLQKLSQITSSRFKFSARTVVRKVQNLKHVFSKTILDSSGTYRIIHNVYKVDGKEGFNGKEDHTNLTLVTHCSVNHMDEIISLAEVWSGPIILTVFIPNIFLSHGFRFLLYMFKCKEKLLKNVTVHFLTEFTEGNTLNLLDWEEAFPQVSCNVSLQIDLTMWKQNYELESLEYPNNLLRNVGIRSAKSEFVFVIDIDMIPSRDFYNKLLRFLSHSPKDAVKTVYVIPAFEIKMGNSHIPENKKVLIKMWDTGHVRPFYYELCEKCQKPTDYQHWKALPDSDMDTVSVGYSVEWKDPWEPYFVSPTTMPLFDERFKQYGFNRISQVCELHVAGYQFQVLNNLFIIHHGYKTAGQFHRTKEIEQNRNRLLFRQFKQELKTKYSDSSRRCY